MSERKSFDNVIESNRHMVISHNRRMDEVRKNFSVSVEGMVAARPFNRESRSKKRARNRDS